MKVMTASLGTLFLVSAALSVDSAAQFTEKADHVCEPIALVNHCNKIQTDPLINIQPCEVNNENCFTCKVDGNIYLCEPQSGEICYLPPNPPALSCGDYVLSQCFQLNPPNGPIVCSPNHPNAVILGLCTEGTTHECRQP